MILQLLEKKAGVVRAIGTAARKARASKALGFLNKGKKVVDKTLAPARPGATAAQAGHQRDLFGKALPVADVGAYNKARTGAEGIVQHTKRSHKRGLESLVRRRLEALSKES